MRNTASALLALSMLLGCDGADDGSTDSNTAGDTDADTETDSTGAETDTDTAGTGTSGGSTGAGSGGGSTGGGVMGEPCDFNEAMCGDGTWICLQIELTDAMGTCVPPCEAATDCDAAGFTGYGCCTIDINSQGACLPEGAMVPGVTCG